MKKTPARTKATAAAKTGGSEDPPLPTRATARRGKPVTSDVTAPGTVDAYIAACAPEVRKILDKVRAIVRKEAPASVEKISYRMPAFMMNGALVYFAAFKNHIGMYPPVKGDARLMKDLAPHLGEKGNLKFPLDQTIPYELIRRVVQNRVKEQQARAAAKRRKRR